jgi:hypothetical protein
MSKTPCCGEEGSYRVKRSNDLPPSIRLEIIQHKMGNDNPIPRPRILRNRLCSSQPRNLEFPRTHILWRRRPFLALLEASQKRGDGEEGDLVFLVGGPLGGLFLGFGVRFDDWCGGLGDIGGTC